MKSTEHKTTMLDVMRFLLDGPQYADDIGAHFWPDKIGYGPARGGPSSCAVAATWLLSRMHHKGLVEKQRFEDLPNYRKWFLTDKGHEQLRAAAPRGEERA